MEAIERPSQYLNLGFPKITNAKKYIAKIAVIVSSEYIRASREYHTWKGFKASRAQASNPARGLIRTLPKIAIIGIVRAPNKAGNTRTLNSNAFSEIKGRSKR